MQPKLKKIEILTLYPGYDGMVKKPSHTTVALSGQCSGYRSLRYVAYRIRIHQQAKELWKSFISTVLRRLNDLLSLKTDVMHLQWVISPNFEQKSIFGWHLESHWRKEQYPQSSVWIRLIRGSGCVSKPHISGALWAVFRIRIWIRIHRIHMFLGLPDPDPLVRGIDPDPALDPSIIMQK